MKKPIFLLGVGAQKAGTTLLYDYIKNDPNSNLGILKEYHIWDALYKADLCSNFISKDLNSISMKSKIRHQMQFNLDAYENNLNR